MHSVGIDLPTSCRDLEEVCQVIIGAACIDMWENVVFNWGLGHTGVIEDQAQVSKDHAETQGPFLFNVLGAFSSFGIHI